MRVSVKGHGVCKVVKRGDLISVSPIEDLSSILQVPEKNIRELLNEKDKNKLFNAIPNSVLKVKKVWKQREKEYLEILKSNDFSQFCELSGYFNKEEKNRKLSFMEKRYKEKVELFINSEMNS